MATFLHLHAATNTTVYDILERNNIPQGFIPKGVKSYTLRPLESHLEARLGVGHCDLTFVAVGGKRFKFRFAHTFGGVIGYGALREVYGVSVQAEKGFAWVRISKVLRDAGAGDQLIILGEQEFDEYFPTSDFTVRPACSSIIGN
uniref:Uncharacterized protein n=1 Tax=Leersia perrieri TaxID=77586 RepID=A0A0D9WXK5_9ORYZ